MSTFKKITLKLFVLLILFNGNLYAKQIPNSFADLAEKLMPSVVNISTTQTIKTQANPFPFQFPPGSPFEDMFKEFERPTERKATSLGSGFIIDKNGTIVTNNHVIANADDIIVKIDSKEYDASVVGTDPLADIAVLKINSSNEFEPVKFGNSDKARVGDWVVAIGNPFGLGGTVTSGIISAKHRDIHLTRYDDLIQTDASINRGNSGGPLFNLEGKVIGINTAIIAPGQSGSIGIGFAIPSNAVSNTVDQLIEFGETKRGWLGVSIQTVTREIAEVNKLDKPKGALVSGLLESGPAKKAGIKPGDIILEFDGKEVKTSRSLQRIVGDTKVGKNVAIKIWRNNKLITKRVTLGRLESSKAFLAENKSRKKIEEVEIEDLEITVRNLTAEDIEERNLEKNFKGVVITQILSRSKLSFLLSSGDIIVEFQGQAIRNVDDLKKVSKQIFENGDKILYIRFLDKSNAPSYGTVKIK